MSKLHRVESIEASDLLKTKLTPPPRRGPFIPRESLLARLDEGLTRKLILVAAPAGFGKTTLAAEWIAARRYPVAWVSLDAGDNDPIRFWRYVVTACRAFDPAIGRSALAALHMVQQPSPEAILIPFINELAQLSSHSILALDDYHALTAPEINQTLAFLLDHLPTAVHVLLISRTEPALPLARLRARNELIELTAADLRFSIDETRSFLQQSLGSSLSPAAVARLDQRAEGWAAGLRLISLALQGKTQAAEQVLSAITGEHRHILEYLTSEVLAAQPEPTQEFLLQTSFLPRLTGSLCAAVTGRSDSGTLLQQLEHANLFLIPLGVSSGQPWYRYYALFAEAMQHYARQRLGEGEVRALHEKASLWFENDGLLNDAVEEAIAAGQFSRAGDLIERLLATRSFNELYTLIRWCEHLPDDVLHKHPLICFSYGNALLFTLDRFAPATAARVDQWWQIAETHWRNENNDARLGQIFASRAVVALWQSDLTRSFAYSHQALELLAEHDVDYRGIILLNIAVEELLAGNINSAQRVIMEARALCEAAQSIHGTLAAIGVLGEVCYQQGEYDQAVYYFEQALRDAVGDEGMLDDQSNALCGLSAIAYERDDLQAAEQYAARALELGQRRHEEKRQVEASLILAQVQHARGQTPQAQSRLQALAASIRQPLLLRELRAGQARLGLAAGDFEHVQAWSDALHVGDDHAPPIQHERETLIIARLQIAQGQTQAALDLLEGWRDDAHRQGRIRSEVEILCVLALAHFAQSDLHRAEQALVRALTIGEAKGFRRTFLDEGEPMAALLQAVIPNLTRRPLAAYGATLLRAFPMSRTNQLTGVPLIEPLSAQEQRILRLIVAGLSNPDIADELVVSTNTVKTHVKNIYRKLGVSTREEAQQAAHELNLL